jgi:hypothetical protein
MGAPAGEIEKAPQSAHRLVVSTVGLYRRYPLLFLALAAAVVLPYDAIVLALTGTGAFAQGSLGASASLLLTVTDLALVGPLVSAMHVHAVKEVREGRDPQFSLVAWQGLRVLPVVAAVSIVSWFGILVGFLLFIAPGVYLMLRWSVVAQAAAIEHEGWMSALRRSGDLVDGHYGHVFVLGLYVTLLTVVPGFLIGLGFSDDSTSVVSFLTGAIFRIIVYSFSALIVALLYYDLRARWRPATAPIEVTPESAGDDSAPSDHSWDPRHYPMAARPKGWYVDPLQPNRMRYWDAGDPPAWGATTHTPRQIKRAWEEMDQGGEGER